MIADDLLKIRALNGSQHYAFEELCCQLASLEPRQPGTSFVRKGSGADAGVECFLLHADNTETGWQAKLFDIFKSGQASQLTESFANAIEKHPRLTRYIVCLPIDLKDGRTGKEKSEGQRWEDWKIARLEEVKKLGRSIDIELWQATNIRERLYRQDPYYSGRMKFFFDELSYSIEWFFSKFNISCDVLGARYTPQFHVSLPIRQSFLGIMRDVALDDQRAELVQQLHKKFKSLKMTLISTPLPQTTLQPLNENGQKLIKSIGGHFSVAEDFPLTEWRSLVDDLKKEVRECFEFLWPLDNEDVDDSIRNVSRTALNALFEFKNSVNDLNEVLYSKAWKLANEHAVLVFGEAGVGKSHLLADLAADTLKKGCPAILLISSQFFPQDPRTQILEHLDMRGLTFDAFLGALDSAGQAAGQRAVIMIDALNERYGIELWREYLATLISEVKRFPHVVLIVSCRSTYLNALFPLDSPLSESLQRIEHHGFSDGGGRAARAYLAQRNVVRPSAPNLLPEFNNPLFLKTCCDSLDKQGLKEFPRGVQGISQYFSFYLESLITIIETRMKLDKYQKIVQRALDGLTQRMLSTCSSYLTLDDAISCLEAVLPSMGLQERSLVSELEHEGIITIEPVYTGTSQLEEQVRFTFERFSDFQIASYLLQTHLQNGHSLRPLEAASPLQLFWDRDDIYRFAGIVDALAVILPEQADIEFPELFTEEDCNWVIEEAFLNSLLLRRQDTFTEKTKKLVIQYSGAHRNHWLTTLIAVATESSNPFNSHYLHAKLAPLTMPERDAHWSIPIAELDLEEGSPLDILLCWALESGFDDIEPLRAELSAIALTWLFSTPHRTIRDRATKSLSALLAPRLMLACALVERFRLVDDLYVIERMLAAIYGAALQSKSHDGVAVLATMVYEWQFADGKPPTHVLLRDYARGIVEYANSRGVLPAGIELKLIRPPYRSDWPIEYVSEKELEKYKDSRDAYRDEIVESAGSEWTGDFAKYIIASAVCHWTATPLGNSAALSPFEAFIKFTEDVSENGADAQQQHLSDLLEFCRKCFVEDQKDDADDESDESAISTPVKIRFVSRSDDYWQRRRENEERFKKLENALLDVLDNNLRYNFQTYARHYLSGLINGYTSDRPDSFDAILAQRWICKRAHKFGWSNELFGEFDKRIGTGRGRNDKHIERIGKKYQWLALYELLARMADNLIYKPSFSGEAEAYDGPWQISERNIDPSLLIKKTQDDGWKKHPAVWWSPVSLRLKHLNKSEQLLWLDNDSDQLNCASFIDIAEPLIDQRWLVLKGFKHYGTPYDMGSHIDSWCRIWCVVLPKNQTKRFIAAIAKKTLIDPHALPTVAHLDDSFVGEYPWHPACSIDDEWKTIDWHYGYRGKVLPTVSKVEKGTGGYDYSLEQNLNFYLPAPWLIQKLGMQLVDGRELCFANHAGLTLFKDPSIHELGPSVALIDKAAFIDLLEKESLSPVWIIAGEKGAYGEHTDDFVGRRMHSYVYQLDETNTVVCTRQYVTHERRQ